MPLRFSLSTFVKPIAQVESYINVTVALNQAAGLGITTGGHGPAAPAENVVKAVPVVLGRYPLAPLLTFLALLLSYAILAIIIFLLSWQANPHAIIMPSSWSTERTRSAVERWLTTPMPLVATLFPNEDGRRTVAEHSLDMMDDREAGPSGRLKLGLRPDGAGFGVYRQRPGKYEDPAVVAESVSEMDGWSARDDVTWRGDSEGGSLDAAARLEPAEE